MLNNSVSVLIYICTCIQTHNYIYIPANKKIIILTHKKGRLSTIFISSRSRQSQWQCNIYSFYFYLFPLHIHSTTQLYWEIHLKENTTLLILAFRIHRTPHRYKGCSDTVTRRKIILQLTGSSSSQCTRYEGSRHRQKR